MVQFYVAQALSKMDLGRIKVVALDETASKRGYNYVTVFIDLDRKQKPAIFVTPGKGKGCLVLLRRFLREHGDDHNNIAKMLCDISSVFLAAIGESFPGANVTVDWFHTGNRRLRYRHRLAVQEDAALDQRGHLCTGHPVAHHPLHQPCSEVHSARHQTLGPGPQGVHDSRRACHLILSRWTSNHSNARLEELNGIFQAARARVRGYRNVFTFMAMIYFIAAPLGKLIKFHNSRRRTKKIYASPPPGTLRGRLSPPAWTMLFFGLI
ncbi:hypothetical protein DFAR_710002 [Desulfarculales bacterium]